MSSIENIQGLDLEAWERWVAYRKAIRKPLKEVSLHAAALKLSKYGADQGEVVSQSISNQWQGLFELKKGRTDPSEPKQKTDKQRAADDARFAAIDENMRRGWAITAANNIGKLRLCDALLARYQLDRDSADYPDRIEELKNIVRNLIRETKAQDVLGDIHLQGLIRSLWGEHGITRLKALC